MSHLPVFIPLRKFPNVNFDCHLCSGTGIYSLNCSALFKKRSCDSYMYEHKLKKSQTGELGVCR